MAKILCVDFDGVIHSYTSGWKGACEIPDPPVEGAFEWLSDMFGEGYRVCIYSSRSKEPGAIDAMTSWFRAHRADDWIMIDQLEFPTQKPAAFLTIDDRAFCFRGTFPSIQEIENFRPWNDHLKERK